MSGLRASASALVSAVVTACLLTQACGTDAVGVEDCRAIEEARCTAGYACGVVADVEDCQRFYRDQCLHGLAVRSPGRPAVEDCVAAVQAAGECARSGAGEAEGCDAAPCDGILHPESIPACGFLGADNSPPPDPPEKGQAGSGGQGSGDESTADDGGLPAE
jgi:hypothetical protein